MDCSCRYLFILGTVPMPYLKKLNKLLLNHNVEVKHGKPGSEKGRISQHNYAERVFRETFVPFLSQSVQTL